MPFRLSSYLSPMPSISRFSYISSVLMSSKAWTKLNPHLFHVLVTLSVLYSHRYDLSFASTSLVEDDVLWWAMRILRFKTSGFLGLPLKMHLYCSRRSIERYNKPQLWVLLLSMLSAIIKSSHDVWSLLFSSHVVIADTLLDMINIEHETVIILL